MSKYLIAPRLSLPMKKKQGIFSRQVFPSLLGMSGITSLLGLLLYRLLAPWPVYCIVGLIIVVLLSSNVLSSMVRTITKKQTLTLLGHASHWSHVSEIQAHSEELLRNTTGFLIAIRKTYLP